tara:strand:- start:112 stop:1344 length:1233 start_codon:yes stop_codon:yes gene_type:complete
MEILYFILAALLSGLVMYVIMSQIMSKKILQTQMDAKILLAGMEDRESIISESLTNYEKTMKDSFELLANSAFEAAVAKADAEKTSTFNKATESLAASLNEYAKNMNSMEAKSIERGTRLEERIDAVSKLGLKLSDQTNNLTNALKADSQAQGAWGELVLENLLQSLGFERNKDYSTQKSFALEDGTRPRTDFIINLPENRHIVIDSKVSLTAWERYVNSTDEKEMEIAMKEHCASILGHAKGLASKNYQGIDELNTVDFVLMYVPLESAFSAAMKMHPDLYMEFARDNKVRVVTGSTIVTTLMLIKEIWKREDQTANQIKLIAETGKIYDQIVLFLEAFTSIGFELKQATSAYDDALSRLSEGRGNIVKRSENLKVLGAKVTKQINDNSKIKEANLLATASHSHENSEE